MAGNKFPDYSYEGGLSVGAPFFRNSSEDFAIMQSYDIQAGENDKRLNEVIDELWEAINGGVSGSAKPTEVSTEAKMNEILASATPTSVGAVYKYTGATTATYEHGAIYIISEAILDGDGVRY